MTEPIARLIQALQTELEEHGGLLHLFEQQQACVLQHDAEGYLHLNEMLDEQLATLSRCRAVRQSLSCAAARSFGRPGETPLPELVKHLPAAGQSLLKALLEEIPRVVDRTNRRAKQNQLLLARCLTTARSVVSTFCPGGTYSASGATSLLRPGAERSAVAVA